MNNESILEPGLYRATIGSKPDQIVMVGSHGWGYSGDAVPGYPNIMPGSIVGAHRLIVLDLDAADSGEHFSSGHGVAHALRRAANVSYYAEAPHIYSLLCALADQIEAQA